MGEPKLATLIREKRLVATDTELSRSNDDGGVVGELGPLVPLLPLLLLLPHMETLRPEEAPEKAGDQLWLLPLLLL